MTRHGTKVDRINQSFTIYGQQDEQARLSAEKEIRLLRLLQPCPQVVRCIDAVILPGTTHNCQVRKVPWTAYAMSCCWMMQFFGYLPAQSIEHFITSKTQNSNPNSFLNTTKTAHDNTKPKQLEALILMENCSGGNLLDIIRARATMTAGGSRQQPMRFTREEILRVAEDVGRCVFALLFTYADHL